MATAPVTVTVNQNGPGAVLNKIAQIKAYSKGLIAQRFAAGPDSGRIFILIGDAASNIQQQIYALAKDLKQLASALNTNAVNSGHPLIQEVTATHGTTTAIVAARAATVGALLDVFVTQDSTGGGLISWNSSFRWAITNIDTTANTVSVFTFIGRIDQIDSVIRWFMTGIPLTGQV